MLLNKNPVRIFEERSDAVRLLTLPLSSGEEERKPTCLTAVK
jgi:hypothetical protein